MTASSPAAAVDAPATTGRRRRWGRRLLVVAAVVVLGVVALVVIGVGLARVAPPLTLPRTAASPPAGPLDGLWQVGDGAVAGFRIGETVLFVGNEVVGRTRSVSGTVRLAHDAITRADVQVALATLTINGHSQGALMSGLAVRSHPTGTFSLTGALPLPAAFTGGAVFATTLQGELTLRGATHAATVTLHGRRSGATIELAGAIPVDLSRWQVTTPSSYGPLGSLDHHATAEFLLFLQRVAR
jgi:hypothetical protein